MIQKSLPVLSWLSFYILVAVAPILMSTGTNLLKFSLYGFSTSPFLWFASSTLTWAFADWSVRMMLNSLCIFHWLSTMWHIDFAFPWFTSKTYTIKTVTLFEAFCFSSPVLTDILCSDTICYLHIPSLNHRLALLLWQLLRCKIHFSWHLSQLIHPPLIKVWKYFWDTLHFNFTIGFFFTRRMPTFCGLLPFDFQESSYSLCTS